MLRKLGCRLPLVAVVVAVAGFATVGLAGTITVGGKITQSTSDGTGPAGNNPTLNNIQDLQAYLVTLVFPGSITTTVTYSLSSLTFSVPTAPASEISFGSSSLTVAAASGFDQFILLGCLFPLVSGYISEGRFFATRYKCSTEDKR
jgi:hypothetical protein